MTTTKANATSFQPGQSGNPAGRPKKSRAMTAILEHAGGAMMDTPDGRTSRKRYVVKLAWEMATTGKMVFPDGTVFEATLRDWQGMLQWIFAQIDGPPRQAMELTGKDGEALKIEHSIGMGIVEDEEANRLAHALLCRLTSDASGAGAPTDGEEVEAGEAFGDA